VTPLIMCFVWFVLIIIIAGVIIWALASAPNLDADLKAWGRIVLIVLTVIMLVITLANCLGFHSPFAR